MRHQTSIQNLFLYPATQPSLHTYGINQKNHGFMFLNPATKQVIPNSKVPTNIYKQKTEHYSNATITNIRCISKQKIAAWATKKISFISLFIFSRAQFSSWCQEQEWEGGVKPLNVQEDHRPSFPC